MLCSPGPVKRTRRLNSYEVMTLAVIQTAAPVRDGQR